MLVNQYEKRGRVFHSLLVTCCSFTGNTLRFCSLLVTCLLVTRSFVLFVAFLLVPFYLLPQMAKSGLNAESPPPGLNQLPQFMKQVPISHLRINLGMVLCGKQVFVLCRCLARPTPISILYSK